MTQPQNILLSLLKGDYSENLFNNLTDDTWKAVTKIAAEQGVYALAYDAIANLHSDLRPPKGILLNWAINVEKLEKRYSRQLTVLNKLSGSLEEHNLKCILMKGFSISRYYPVEFHRECGDIDIYPGSDYQKVNESIIKMGGKVEEDYYRHAHCVLGGITIENHLVMSDVRVKKGDLLLEEALMKEAERIFNSSPSPGVLYPSPNFNALFLSWHAASHFMFEKIQLRHIYDWKVFLENELDKVDLEWFTSLKSQLSYGKFADILTAAVIKLFGVDESILPKQIIESVNQLDEKLVDRVIDYIFESDSNDKGKTLWAHRLDLVKRAFKDSWKYREIYDMSVMEMLWCRGKGIFRM